MEIFVDFGLFELLAVAGILAFARVVYSRRTTGFLFLLASIGLPAATILVAEGGRTRWLSVLTLATALVNAAVVLGALQRGEVPTPEIPGRGRGRPGRSPSIPAIPEDLEEGREGG